MNTTAISSQRLPAASGFHAAFAAAAPSLEVFVKAHSVFVAAIVIAAMLALFLKETGSAAHKAP